MPANVKSMPLGPWPKGETNVVRDTEFTPRECATAENVLLTPVGHVDPAREWQQRTGVSFSSMYRHRESVYATDGDQLVRFPGMATTSNWVGAPIYQMPVTNPRLRFCPGLGKEFLATGGGMLIAVEGDTVIDLTRQAPGPLNVAVITGSGGLPPGKYRLTHAEGHDRPMSDPVDIELTEPAKLQCDTTLQVYCTNADGQILYAAPHYITAERDLKAQAPQADLVAMKPGRHVGTFNARVATAAGDMLWLSEPYMPTMAHPVAGFIRMPGNVAMLAGVADKLFVGTDTGTYVIGEDEAGFSLALVHDAPVQATQPCWLTTGSMPQGNNTSTPLTGAAVWVTVAGVAVGLPTGNVLLPRDGRFIINGSPPFVLAATDTRIYCLGGT